MITEKRPLPRVFKGLPLALSLRNSVAALAPDLIEPPPVPNTIGAPVDSPELVHIRAALPHFATAPAPPLKTDNLDARTAKSSSTALGQAKGLTTTGFSSAEFGSADARRSSGSGSHGTLSQTGAFAGIVADPLIRDPSTRDKQALVMAGGFGDASTVTGQRPALPSPSSSSSSSSSSISTTISTTNSTTNSTARPVEILEKPRPEYTSEARRLQIEGEVLIEVVFAATGELRVIRFVRGLGHGLDESALIAVRKIRYRAAEQSGTPVDASAIVHLVFQLAY